MQALMQTWKDGGEPKVGPQNGRKNSNGHDKRTSLEDIPLGENAQISRDFAGEK
jgi:hypothetical protein